MFIGNNFLTVSLPPAPKKKFYILSDKLSLYIQQTLYWEQKIIEISTYSRAQ